MVLKGGNKGKVITEHDIVKFAVPGRGVTPSPCMSEAVNARLRRGLQENRKLSPICPLLKEEMKTMFDTPRTDKMDSAPLQAHQDKQVHPCLHCEKSWYVERNLSCSDCCASLRTWRAAEREGEFNFKPAMKSPGYA